MYREHTLGHWHEVESHRAYPVLMRDPGFRLELLAQLKKEVVKFFPTHVEANFNRPVNSPAKSTFAESLSPWQRAQ